MNVGGPELLILLLLILPLGLGIATAVDAGGRPDWAFERAGTSKTLWVVLPIVGIVACGLVAIIAAIIWFTSVKPRVVAATENPPM